MDARHDEHYLREVTSLGDSRPMVAHAPIYGQNRIKLVDVGARITGALFEKLVQHKLLPPIDECVAVEDAVTAKALAAEAARIVAERPFLARLAESVGDADRLLAPLAQIALEPAFAFKLTVMQARRPELYRHSLEVAIIALYLGRSCRLDGARLRALATGAVFHDLGELHIDPAILDPAHHITDEERRHIYAHPVTAFLILNNYPAYAGEISGAVMEHHERSDGSGYPRGIRGAEISTLGRILVLAEVVASLIRKLPAGDDLSRICVALKFNSQKYDQTLISRLSEAFRATGHAAAAGDGHEEGEFLAKIERLGSLFGSWQAAYESLAESRQTGPLAKFVDGRVLELERALSDAGCHPDQLSLAYSGAAGDAAAMAEMAELADEGIWQFRNILRECQRNWESLEEGDAERQRVRQWLDSCGSVLDEPAAGS